MPTHWAAFEPWWFFAFVVAILLAISVAIAYGSGWRTLARRFRSTRSIEGERFRLVSGLIGAPKRPSALCRGCFFITVGAEGFLLSVFFLFRLGNPPLFFPWTEIESVTEELTWFVTGTVICIRGVPTRIVIFGRAGQRIGQAYAHFSASKAT
jgi:hypothetical protein